jgi:DNA-binding NtrC family response regulator
MSRLSSQPRILIADDQEDVLEALRLLLKPEGFNIDSAATPQDILEALKRKDYDAILMDLNYTRDTTSGQEGLDLLNRIQELDSTLPVIVLTAWGSVDLVVEAMRRGARDFIQKPWDNERLFAIVRTQLELGQSLRIQQRLTAENELLRGDSKSFPKLIAELAAMKPVLQLISNVGPSDANVLLTGENGTGKGVVAQALHAVSERASESMVTVNVGGLSEGVFESELFGHVKGA